MRKLLLCGLLTAAAAADATAEGYAAESYATCSACHLPDGAGVPGAFPPVRGRAARIAARDGGRAYLIAVVSYGLMGTIEVAGARYFGVMAGTAGALQPDDIAAALNYVVFELDDAAAAGVEPFTAAEVEKVQAETKLKSPAGGGELRKALESRHGDEWP